MPPLVTQVVQLLAPMIDVLHVSPLQKGQVAGGGGGGGSAAALRSFRPIPAASARPNNMGAVLSRRARREEIRSLDER
jgi:hypothetical protein